MGSLRSGRVGLSAEFILTNGVVIVLYQYSHHSRDGARPSISGIFCQRRDVPTRCTVGIASVFSSPRVYRGIGFRVFRGQILFHSSLTVAARRESGDSSKAARPFLTRPSQARGRRSAARAAGAIYPRPPKRFISASDFPYIGGILHRPRCDWLRTDRFR